MSGLSSPPAWPETSTSSRFAAWPPDHDAARRRLLVALAASCLLHALTLALPLLGERQPEFRFALKGEQRFPFHLNATLVVAGSHRFAGAPVPAEGENVTHSSPVATAKAGEVRPEQPGASGAGLLPTPAMLYYAADQLTKRPQPIAPAELEPPAIKPIVASGRIVLRLWITDRGSVNKVDVETSTMPGMFTRAAVQAFERMQFVPGERNGRRVGSMLRIEVNYEDGRQLPR